MCTYRHAQIYLCTQTHVFSHSDLYAHLEMKSDTLTQRCPEQMNIMSSVASYSPSPVSQELVRLLERLCQAGTTASVASWLREVKV